jgi:hypothetical protein
MNNKLEHSITDVPSSNYACCTPGTDHSTTGCIGHNVPIRTYVVRLNLPPAIEPQRSITSSRNIIRGYTCSPNTTAAGGSTTDSSIISLANGAFKRFSSNPISNCLSCYELIFDLSSKIPRTFSASKRQSSEHNDHAMVWTA